MEFDPNVSFENTAIAFSSKSDRQLRKANLIFSVINIPWLSALAQKMALLAMNWGLPIKRLIRNTIYEQFCGGEDIESVGGVIDTLQKQNVYVILDYAVEGKEEEDEYDRTAVELEKALRLAADKPAICFCVLKMTGIASRALLEKIQSESSLNNEEQESFNRVKQRLDRICSLAYTSHVALLVDGEESWIQNVIDEMTFDMMKKYNTTEAIIYNTSQMYRKDSLMRVKASVELATAGGYVVGAKIVRGAYMEKESKRAEENGYDNPIQPTKVVCDRDFNDCLAYCVERLQTVRLCCGSHNELSNHWMASLINKMNLAKDDTRVWFAQLYGMSDNISFNLAAAGYRVAKYVPYGPVKTVMPYLIRRAQENTSVAGQSSRELRLIRMELNRRRKIK